jgi:hypothetical protein
MQEGGPARSGASNAIAGRDVFAMPQNYNTTRELADNGPMQ